MNLTLSILAAVALLPGHAALLVASHNWWYGTLKGRWVTDFSHVVHGLLLTALPVYLVPFMWPVLPWGDIAGPACTIFAILGWVLLVMATTRRVLKRGLPEVGKAQREVLNPGDRLGYSGQGRGFRGWMASIPGNEVLRPEIRLSVVELTDLPLEWDGLKILHLSDLHFSGTPTREWFQVVLAECSRHGPDMVVLTGDIVEGLPYHSWIGGTLGRLPSKAIRVGILGNHDVWNEPGELVKELTRHGFNMVGNRETVLVIRGRPMRFVGNEFPWRGSRHFGNTNGTGLFTVALCHTPDEAEWAAAWGASLIFAGHVHGGQVRLPIIGPVIIPSRHGRKYDMGWFRIGKSLLHVSSGLGQCHPLRWGCPPAADLITLRVPVPEAGS